MYYPTTLGRYDGHMPVILAFKRLRQEECEFKSILGYIARCWLQRMIFEIMYRTLKWGPKKKCFLSSKYSVRLLQKKWQKKTLLSNFLFIPEGINSWRNQTTRGCHSGRRTILRLFLNKHLSTLHDLPVCIAASKETDSSSSFSGVGVLCTPQRTVVTESSP